MLGRSYWYASELTYWYQIHDSFIWNVVTYLYPSTQCVGMCGGEGRWLQFVSSGIGSYLGLNPHWKNVWDKTSNGCPDWCKWPLFLGSGFSNIAMKVFAEGESRSGISYSLAAILAYVLPRDFVSNGGVPTSIANIIHPNAQISAS